MKNALTHILTIWVPTSPDEIHRTLAYNLAEQEGVVIGQEQHRKTQGTLWLLVTGPSRLALARFVARMQGHSPAESILDGTGEAYLTTQGY